MRWLKFTSKSDLYSKCCTNAGMQCHCDTLPTRVAHTPKIIKTEQRKYEDMPLWMDKKLKDSTGTTRLHLTRASLFPVLVFGFIYTLVTCVCLLMRNFSLFSHHYSFCNFISCMTVKNHLIRGKTTFHCFSFYISKFLTKYISLGLIQIRMFIAFFAGDSNSIGFDLRLS